MTPLERVIVDRIVGHGPITVAEYMELALYHPEFGYYATREQRSGRAGDFYTSVDAGRLFGACLAQYLASRAQPPPSARFDLVEAGAGNGRLARDILDAAERLAPAFYDRIALHLVERSAAARTAQPATLGPHVRKLVFSSDRMPRIIRGALIANELLDALPCHVVARGEDELQEMYVTLRDGRFALQPGPLSDPALAAYLNAVGARLERGWRAEVSLAARDWVREASRALEAGELLIFDYGHAARERYSAAHADGTLVRYAAHRVDTRWLEQPGESDLTAHVDFTTVRQTAEAEHLRLARFTDQTRFLLDAGITERLPTGAALADVRARLAARTLLAPEGLGGTIKVMILVRDA